MTVATSWERLKSKLALRGRFIDYWTAIHFATGVVVGFFLAQRDMSFVAGLAFASALFILWEWIEPDLHRYAGRDFPEQWTNQVTYVIVGAAGYMAGYLVASPRVIDPLSSIS